MFVGEEPRTIAAQTNDAASCEAASGLPLQRDPDCNSRVGVAAIIQVITIVDVADVDFVSVIPVVRPVLRPWIHQAEPITPVLKARKTSNYQERPAVDSEPMLRPKISTEASIRDAITVVASALLPCVMVRLPAF